MDIRLKPELEKLIEDEVKSGNRSTDPNEFLNKAVYHFVLHQISVRSTRRLKSMELIGEGLADIDRVNTIDGGEALRQLRSYTAERRRHRA